MEFGYIGLMVSVVLIGISVYGFLNSKNIVRIFLSSEILVNASILIVFSVSSLTNQVYLPIYFSLFAIGMALVEIVVAFAAIFLYYRNKGSLEVE
ncbi:NADH-ubiquinone oxidoreductase subunit 4L [Sulfolobus acidocaldarius SUSAZ]|nr:NADH-ubiquinone oxidoreductase subunit 4L [Sulfolobus acidocaldarius SUSAZ]